MEELFFQLIQIALGQRACLSRTPNEKEWKALYELAKKQSLVGICFAGVRKLVDQQQTPEEMLYLTWMGMAAKIQQKNETVNKQCIELQKKLTADGFRNYIMKGQAVGSLYKLRAESGELRDLSALRQSGDIDVFLEGELEKVLAYARTFGETSKVNELEMSVNVFPDTEVEFHYRPFIMRNPIKNKRLQKFFADCEEKNFTNRIKLCADSLEITAPTTEFNLVHQLVHIYHHFITGGIGLRQLMDYYFVLRTVSDSSSVVAEPVEVQEVSKVVSSLGLDRFASALMWVLNKVFGLSMVGVPWLPNEKDGKDVLEEVMIAGNFGHGDERTNGLLEDKWRSFWYFQKVTFRYLKYDSWAWFWSPSWRIYHFCWRKAKGFA